MSHLQVALDRIEQLERRVAVLEDSGSASKTAKAPDSKLAPDTPTK